MDADAKKSVASGVIFISLTLIGWSSVPLFLKHFTLEGRYIDAWTANGWRYGVSAILWAPVLVVGAGRRKLPPNLWKAALIPSIINCIGQVTFAWTPYFIGPGLQAFLIRFQIIVVTLGAYLLFPSERRVLSTLRYWIGLSVVFLGSIGTFLLGEKSLQGGTAVGIALGVFSGLVFGGYALSVRYYMHGVNPVISFGAISQYTAIMMVSIMLVFADGNGLSALKLSWGDQGMLLLSAIVGIALGHVFYYASIARLGVSVAAGVTLVAPFLTAAASHFIFEEVLTPWQWCSGLAAMIGAVAVLSVQRNVKTNDASSSDGTSASQAALHSENET